MVLSRSWVLAVVLCAPVAHAAAPRVVTSAPYLVLGEETAVHVTVVPTRPDAVLRAVTNAGALLPLAPTTGPERHFTYQPPPERVPRIALLAFWEEGSGAPELAVHRLPLHGRMILQVRTRPGAEVMVKVGGHDFGPVRASRAGTIGVDVEVPPGVTSAQVRARASGQERRTELPIELPRSNPLFAVLTSAWPDAQHPSWLWVLHAQSLPGPMLEFTSRGVRLERVRFFKDRALFRVTQVQDGREPFLEVRLAGAPDAVAQAMPWGL
ncbi:MAG: hypothetical protein L0Y66_17980 [Myxococcaceae bacterium]|nr:hypothetical protein [Myxococcaceae bacterium]